MVDHNDVPMLVKVELAESQGYPGAVVTYPQPPTGPSEPQQGQGI